MTDNTAPTASPTTILHDIVAHAEAWVVKEEQLVVAKAKEVWAEEEPIIAADLKAGLAAFTDIVGKEMVSVFDQITKGELDSSEAVDAMATRAFEIFESQGKQISLDTVTNIASSLIIAAKAKVGIN